MPADLTIARRAYDQHDWPAAYEGLRTAETGPDLERLAVAAQLIGLEEESVDAYRRAHTVFLKEHEVERAVRCAAQLVMSFINRGDMAQAQGWLARARRILDDSGSDCVEAGYLLIPVALQALFGADPQRALEVLSQVAEIAARFGDADLQAMGRLGRGQCFIQLGDITAGTELFDENMAAVMSGEVSPPLTGLVYCAIIDSCRGIFDLRRAREWTVALDHWCESQPGIVQFRGACLVFRAQLMQFQGAWPAALGELEKACERLSTPRLHAGAGEAFYALGELHRMRGDSAAAESAYRRAHDLGRSPQPGLALLRLANGHVAAAAAAIAREREEARSIPQACAVLPAYVEIMIAARNLDLARDAVFELAAHAEHLGAPFLRAMADHARGAVALASDEHRQALEALRSAAAKWRELEAPYDAARTRVLIGLACRAAGDVDAAALELEAARRAFEQLGARRDLARLDELSASRQAAGLTARELQVLRLVAAGKTNKAIAADLFISEKTVARHVSNIFDKLGLASRAAATAYAYEHGLQIRPT